MIQDFVSNMLNDNIELRKHCASAIFKCAQVQQILLFSNIDIWEGRGGGGEQYN